MMVVVVVVLVMVVVGVVEVETAAAALLSSWVTTAGSRPDSLYNGGSRKKANKTMVSQSDVK